MRSSHPCISHTLPFALFALLTVLAGVVPVPQGIVYPIQTLLVAGMVVFFWPSFALEIHPRMDWLALAAGIAAYGFWVGLENTYPLLGTPAATPPDVAAGPTPVAVFLVFRLFGSCVLVPVVEELFWRSFALRYLVDRHILQIPLGTFTWFSFAVVTLAFGLEHHRWFPGMIAGALYAGLLYHRRNLFSPILAHAVTNTLLSAHVLFFKHWSYW